VIVWADDATHANGSIVATGAGGGRGGLVESSAHTLEVNGIRVNTGGGLWLLDPNDFAFELPDLERAGAARVRIVEAMAKT